MSHRKMCGGESVQRRECAAGKVCGGEGVQREKMPPKDRLIFEAAVFWNLICIQRFVFVFFVEIWKYLQKVCTFAGVVDQNIL